MSDFAWDDGSIMAQIGETIKTLGWEPTDDIAVEVGGTSVYGIDGAGTKWAPLKGTRKYNKDAFIVIKNRSRNPVVPSQANLNTGEQSSPFFMPLNVPEANSPTFLKVMSALGGEEGTQMRKMSRKLRTMLRSS